MSVFDQTVYQKLKEHTDVEFLQVRHYTGTISFTHYISNRSELTDKTCCNTHGHENVKIKVELLQSGWIDYKTMKQLIEPILDSYRGNIGEADTETITKNMLSLLFKAFPKAAGIGIDIQETSKYEIEVKGWRRKK